MSVAGLQEGTNPQSVAYAAGAAVALGTEAKCASGEVSSGVTLDKWAAQDHAAGLWSSGRVAKCHRKPHGSNVSVIGHRASKSATFAGLQTCASVWACPVCASKISERRRVELTEALETHLSRGGVCILVTYTVRHHKGDRLRAMVGAIKAARKFMRSGRKAETWAARWGVVGTVRALEVTHGKNGWHPHVHELVFLDHKPSTSLFLADMQARWKQAIERQGLKEVNSHAVSVSLCDMSAANYVAKFGQERSWGAEHEVTKAVCKTGREGSRSPSDLLRDSAHGDTEASLLWLEYACTMKGEAQLAWSRGLRKHLDLGRVKTDEELADEQTEPGEELVSLDWREWFKVCRRGLRAPLLEVASTQDVGQVLAFLRAWGILPAPS